MKYSLIGFPARIDVIFAKRKIHAYWGVGVRGSDIRLKTFTAIADWGVLKFLKIPTKTVIFYYFQNILKKKI